MCSCGGIFLHLTAWRASPLNSIALSCFGRPGIDILGIVSCSCNMFTRIINVLCFSSYIYFFDPSANILPQSFRGSFRDPSARSFRGSFCEIIPQIVLRNPSAKSTYHWNLPSAKSLHGSFREEVINILPRNASQERAILKKSYL